MYNTDTVFTRFINTAYIYLFIVYEYAARIGADGFLREL